MPRTDVEFSSEGTTCRGWLYRPVGTWPFPETYHTFKALKETEAPLYQELVTLPHTTHMTLYSDQAKLQMAAGHATSWFAGHLLP